LIGPGGAGKTRLAREVARRRRARDPDGPLAASGNPDGGESLTPASAIRL
jgi:hypothetical protein